MAPPEGAAATAAAPPDGAAGTAGAVSGPMAASTELNRFAVAEIIFNSLRNQIPCILNIPYHRLLATPLPLLRTPDAGCFLSNLQADLLHRRRTCSIGRAYLHCQQHKKSGFQFLCLGVDHSMKCGSTTMMTYASCIWQTFVYFRSYHVCRGQSAPGDHKTLKEDSVTPTCSVTNVVAKAVCNFASPSSSRQPGFTSSLSPSRSNWSFNPTSCHTMLLLPHVTYSVASDPSNNPVAQSRPLSPLQLQSCSSNFVIESRSPFCHGSAYTPPFPWYLVKRNMPCLSLTLASLSPPFPRSTMFSTMPSPKLRMFQIANSSNVLKVLTWPISKNPSKIPWWTDK